MTLTVSMANSLLRERASVELKIQDLGLISVVRSQGKIDNRRVKLKREKKKWALVAFHKPHAATNAHKMSWPLN